MDITRRWQICHEQKILDTILAGTGRDPTIKLPQEVLVRMRAAQLRLLKEGHQISDLPNLTESRSCANVHPFTEALEMLMNKPIIDIFITPTCLGMRH